MPSAVPGWSWFGDATEGQELSDFIGLDLVRAAAYYVEQAPPDAEVAAHDPAAIAGLQRVRALAAQLEAELAALATVGEAQLQARMTASCRSAAGPHRLGGRVRRPAGRAALRRLGQHLIRTCLVSP
jgi:hypothetical protein